jgi:hypothetical protein
MKNESISKAHEIIEENAYDLRKLKRFIVRRKTAIFDSKDATLNQKEKEKEKRITKEIEEKIMKKDKQKRKELELQMKKYVIELLRKYTNVIEINGKKIKLDELLKDLNSVKDDTLIQYLQTQEAEFKKTKEKKLKEVSVNKDYILREFRRRDLEEYKNKLKNQEDSINKEIEEKNKKYEENKANKDNLIKYAKFANNYFDNLKQDRLRVYNENLEIFKSNLNKIVKRDLHKDLIEIFSKYYEDFLRRNEQSEARKKKTDIWDSKKDEKNKKDKKHKKNENDKDTTSFARGAKSEKVEIKKIDNEYKENVKSFKRGSNFDSSVVTIKKSSNDNKDTIPKDGKWARGGNLPKPTDDNKPNDKKEELNKGTKLENPPKTNNDFSRKLPTNEFMKRGSAIPKTETIDKNQNTKTNNNTGFNRSQNAQSKPEAKNKSNLGFNRGGNAPKETNEVKQIGRWKNK